MKTLIFKITLVISASLVSMGTIFAQEKAEKLTENFDVNEQVSLDVDATNTNFIFHTWNKNQVKVEAFIEGDFPEEEQENLLAAWDLKVMGNSGKIQISSQPQRMGFPNGQLAFFMPQNIMVNDSTLFDDNNIQVMIAPMMRDIAQMKPVLPPSFYTNLGEMQFDHEAYEKNGEEYLKSYEKQIQEKFGQDYAREMQVWAEQIQRNMEVRRNILEQRKERMQESRERMEHRAQQLQLHREERQERIQERQEALNKRLEELAENNPNVKYSRTVTNLPNGGKQVEMHFSNSRSWTSEGQAKRNVVVYMPKNAVLNLQIRHGNLELKDAVSNLNAQLAHTSFTAAEISGENTKIHVSYAPVDVALWKYGVLNLGYVQNCAIGTAQSIKLLSKSSDVEIGELEETGILSGSFGELSISEVGNNFKTLQINLENSGLHLKLPKSAFDFSYNGSHSNIDLPASVQVESQNNYGNKFMEGYYLSEKNSSKINIDANFSEVVLKE